MRVMMVCLGNICRSPLAEGILKHKAQEAGLDWHVDSAGTSAWHIGELPDSRSVEVAQKHGIDITDQRAQQFQPYHFEKFDKILVMDSSNYQDVMRLTLNDEEREKIELIMNHLYPGKNMAVPDPYWDDDGFEKVYQMLDAACGQFIAVNS